MSSPLSNMPLLPGILAIDTSTDSAAIACSTGQDIIAYCWQADRNHTTTVLPEIDRLVASADMTPKDLTAIVVAIGPGTFTGLRVGLSIAKGIVAASGIPLIGIPTLDVVFGAHPNEEIIAVLPAGRGRVVWQKSSGVPVNSSLPELAEAMQQIGDMTIVGELTADQRDELQRAGADIMLEHRDPRVLLQLGAHRLVVGDVDDPVTLEPTYLHGVTANAGPIQDRLRK